MWTADLANPTHFIGKLRSTANESGGRWYRQLPHHVATDRGPGSILAVEVGCDEYVGGRNSSSIRVQDEFDDERANLQLSHQAGPVDLHGAFLDAEQCGAQLVGLSFQQELEHDNLALCQATTSSARPPRRVKP
jgi:hypothetical protein